MKKYKFFILAIIALILAFSCFTGFVSVPTVRAEYVDGTFPPFTDSNWYIILDFTYSNIPLANVGLVYFAAVGGGSFRLDQVPSVGYLFEIIMPKSVTPSGTYTCYLDYSHIQDLDYIGFPSISSIQYFDINNNPLSIFTSVTPNLVDITTQDPVSYCVITIDNPLNTLRDEYGSLSSQYNTLREQNDNLEVAFRNQQLQLISETSRANQAEANYNNLLTQYNSLNTQYNSLNTQYNSLNTQYTTLQGDYEDLENLYEEARDSADHYQGLLREANADIDELSADNDRLQGIINNLPPTDLAFGWVGSAFATVDSILSIEIIPNLTIGSLVLIPLVLGVLFFVLRLVRGE